MIRDTIDNNQRLFLSHFTSTTHHPWGVPSKFTKKEYIPHSEAFSKHEKLDAYLNTIRYVDNWLGQFMDLLDEEGIANETLTVFVGDQYVDHIIPFPSLYTKLTPITAAKPSTKTPG